MKQSLQTLLLACCVPSVLFGCHETVPTEDPAVESTGPRVLELSHEARRNAALGVEVAGPHQAKPQLKFQGDVRLLPAQRASVVARVPGVVTQVRKRIGDQVTRGETLAVLESRSLADAKMAYFETEHALEFAQKALEREKGLVAKGITTEEVFQQREHAVEEAQINHAAALQRLKLLGLSEGQLHSLKKDLTQDMATYRVRAPRAGEIIEEAITLGASVAADQVLFSVADLQRVAIETNVPIKDIRAIKVGLPVRLVCTTVDLQGAGEVTYVGAIADRATRTVPVRVETDNHKREWRPGMAARVEIGAEALSLRLAVPLAAVHVIDNQDTVFVEKSESLFELRDVEIGYRDELVAEIIKGIAAGERVVVKNSFLLKSEWLGQEGG